jgi:hypothetical protein
VKSSIARQLRLEVEQLGEATSGSCRCISALDHHRSSAECRRGTYWRIINTHRAVAIEGSIDSAVRNGLAVDVPGSQVCLAFAIGRRRKGGRRGVDTVDVGFRPWRASTAGHRRRVHPDLDVAFLDWFRQRVGAFGASVPSASVPASASDMAVSDV